MTNMEPHARHSTTLQELDDTVFELLDPIHQLSTASRRKLSSSAKTVVLEPGERLKADEWSGKMLFLLDGEVELHVRGRAAELITELHPGVSSPLFPPDNERGGALVAQNPCEIVAFDRRLFEILLEGEREKQAEVEFIETSAFESALFKKLFDAYSQRKLEIPTLKDVAERICKAVEKPDLSEKEMAHLAGADPAFATRVLRAASLVEGGSGAPVHTLLDAVRSLGLLRVRDLAVSQSLLNLCPARSPLVVQRLRQAYEHSIHVAAFSYVLTRKAAPSLDPEQALLAGLLHDVGIFPVLCAADAYMDDPQNRKDLDAVVWKLHGMVGAMVLQQWGFNPVLANVAECCDDWRRDADPRLDYADIVLIAQLHSFVGGARMKGMPQFASVPAFRKLAGAEPAPQFSLRVFHAGRDMIGRLESLLGA
jgi:HD-like signal output (HDOD) protein